MERDPSLDALLELDGQVLVVDPESRHWVRFAVRRVPASEAKPHGLDYSLTLHGPDGCLLYTSGGSGATCEACHGAGREHVEAEGDKTKIFNPGEATAKEVDAKCLSCHQGQHASFERSAHGEGNVSCIGCHSIHASAGPRCV